MTGYCSETKKDCGYMVDGKCVWDSVKEELDKIEAKVGRLKRPRGGLE